MTVAAEFTTPTVNRAPINTDGLAEKIAVRNLDFFYGDHRALKSINVSLYQGKVTAFIGPSGCGKSTLLRILNRMYDLYPNQRATGDVKLDNDNILSSSQDLNLLRAALSRDMPQGKTALYDAVAFALKHLESGRRDKNTGGRTCRPSNCPSCHKVAPGRVAMATSAARSASPGSVSAMRGSSWFSRKRTSRDW